MALPQLFTRAPNDGHLGCFQGPPRSACGGRGSHDVRGSPAKLGRELSGPGGSSVSWGDPSAAFPAAAHCGQQGLPTVDTEGLHPKGVYVLGLD